MKLSSIYVWLVVLLVQVINCFCKDVKRNIRSLQVNGPPPPPPPPNCVSSQLTLPGVPVFPPEDIPIKLNK